MKILVLILSFCVLPLWAAPSLASKNEDLTLHFDGSGTIALSFQFTEALPLNLKKRLWERLSHAAEEAGIAKLDMKISPPPQPPSAMLNISFHHINDLRNLVKAYDTTKDKHNLDDQALAALVEKHLAKGKYETDSLTHIHISRIINPEGHYPEHCSFRLKTNVPFVTTNGHKEADGSSLWENTNTIEISIPWFVFIPRWIMGLIGGILTGSIFSILFVIIKKRIKKNKIKLSQNDSNKKDKMAHLRQNDAEENTDP